MAVILLYKNLFPLYKFAVILLLSKFKKIENNLNNRSHTKQQSSVNELMFF